MVEHLNPEQTDDGLPPEQTGGPNPLHPPDVMTAPMTC